MDRVAGWLLFLPVPLVLLLFTRAPLGVLPSLGLGVLIMATHRLYARPWALGHAARRCLWCGGPIASGLELALDEPGGLTSWRCCKVAHHQQLIGLLGRAARLRRLLRAGILGALVAFLFWASLAALGAAGPTTWLDAVNGFRLAIAITLAPLVCSPTQAPSPVRRALPTPFPAHILALIGASASVWLFRLIGLYWLAASLWFLAQRLGWR